MTGWRAAGPGLALSLTPTLCQGRGGEGDSRRILPPQMPRAGRGEWVLCSTPAGPPGEDAKPGFLPMAHPAYISGPFWLRPSSAQGSQAPDGALFGPQRGC